MNKLRENIKQVIKEYIKLNEIGTASAKPYKYDKFNTKFNDLKTGSTTGTYFDTKSGLEYFINLKPLNHYLNIDYGVEDDNDPYRSTNKHEVFRIMSTITKIVNDVIKDNPDLKGIRYEPQQNGEKKSIQRDKLYRAFIKAKFPKSKFYKKGHFVFADI